MSSRRWMIPLAALGAALLYREMRRRGAARHGREGAGAPSVPRAEVYDAITGRVNEPIFGRIAREVAGMVPGGTVLDAGSGPGRLAVRIARESPGLTVVGLDIAPDMVGLAARRAAAASLADCVGFEVGDVAAMPFRDGQFDLVVSSFSMHHWADPNRALAEIHRVLKPEGQACIYDLADWVLKALHHHGGEVSWVRAADLFRGGMEERTWGLGPVPLLRRVCLRRVPAASRETARSGDLRPSPAS